MTLLIPAKVLLHVWSYDFYDMTLSTGKQRRHMINMYITPGQGQSISFLNNKDSVRLPINCKFCPSNDIVTIFPIQMRGQSKLTLP